MSQAIRIESLIPQPFSDQRRVSLTLRVSGLPAYGPGLGSNFFPFSDMPQTGGQFEPGPPGRPPRAPNVELFPDLESPRPLPDRAKTSEDLPGGAPGETKHLSLEEGPGGGGPAPAETRRPSPYPDVTLSILDPDQNEVTTTVIVEHKEPELDFTLHLPAPSRGGTYTARAEMTLNEQIVQTVQVPFELGAGRKRREPDDGPADFPPPGPRGGSR